MTKKRTMSNGMHRKKKKKKKQTSEKEMFRADLLGYHGFFFVRSFVVRVSAIVGRKTSMSRFPIGMTDVRGRQPQLHLTISN